MQHTKSKKGKRLLGVVISCAMLFGMFPGMSVSAAEPETETINLLDYYTAAITGTTTYDCGITVSVGGGGSMTYSSTWSGTTRQFSISDGSSQTAPSTYTFSIDPDGLLAEYMITNVSIG